MKAEWVGRGRPTLLLFFKRTPFALQKDSFCSLKGLLLPTKRGPFACQKDYICKVQAKACKNHINIILQIRLFEVFCIIL